MAPPAKLVSVRVLGSKRLPEANIIRATGLKVGAEVSPHSFQEAANKLAASAVFEDVRYQYTRTAAGLAVVFRVRDAAGFFPCRFENFVWFSAKDLDTRLRSMVPLFTGEVPLTGDLPEQLDRALQTLLRERGIPGTVQHNMLGRAGGPIQALQFRAEGIHIPIRRVEFLGVSQLDPASLQSAVQPLLGTNYDGSFAHMFAAANLSPLYWQRGYLRVAFDLPSADLVKDSNPEPSVQVTIGVHEGSQYRLREIRWSGNSVFPSSELAESIHLKPGEPVNALQLQQDLETLQGLYGTRGYLRASVESRPAFEDPPPRVSYEILVREGELYRMGTVRIAGLDPAHEAALEKMWKLRSAEPYDNTYARTFVSQIGPHLPRNPRGWKIGYKQSLDDAAKTVNVTISVLPKDTPDP